MCECRTRFVDALIDGVQEVEEDTHKDLECCVPHSVAK